MWWFQSFFKDPRVNGYQTYMTDYADSFNTHFGDLFSTIAFSQDCVMWAWPISQLAPEKELYVEKLVTTIPRDPFYNDRYMYEADEYECNAEGVRYKSKIFPYSNIFSDVLDPLAIFAGFRQLLSSEYDAKFYDSIRKQKECIFLHVLFHLIGTLIFRPLVRLEYWIWYIVHVAWFLFHWTVVRFWMWGPQAWLGPVLVYEVFKLSEKVMLFMNIYSITSRVVHEHNEEKLAVKRDRESRQKKEWDYEHSVECADKRSYERMHQANEPYPEKWKIKIGSGNPKDSNW